jgi:type VII secretion protein EccE
MTGTGAATVAAAVQVDEGTGPGVRPRRIGRGRLIALEAVAGAAIAGGALLGAGGWVILAAAVLALALTLGRRDHRWLTELVAARVRRDAATRVLATGSDLAGGLRGAAELGAAAQVAPRLEVTGCTDRNTHPVGVAWDGQGFAAALELDTRTPLRLDLGRLAVYAADDDVPLAGVQLLIEQLGVARTNGNGPVAPAQDPLPGVRLPLMRRAFVAVRYEPIWAPEAARRRGEGGADGARLAVAAALARLRVRLLGHGVSAAPLDADGLARTVRTVGDTAPTGTLHRDCWTTSTTQHHCLGATVATPADWTALLQAAAQSPAERTVVSVAVELDGPSTRTRAAVRVISTDHTRARHARQLLLDTGLTGPLPGAQGAGVLATLPLGGGPRPLTGAIGWTPR